MILCKLLRSRRANVTIEMALVLPILLALAFGTVEFGYYFYLKHTIQSASRDGARMAILANTNATKVNDTMTATMRAGGVSDGKYTWKPEDYTDPNNPVLITNLATVPRGTPVRITITAKYGDVGIRPLGVISADKPVVGATTMVRE